MLVARPTVKVNMSHSFFFSPLWANDLNMESYTSRTIWKVQMYTCSFTDAAIRLTALLSIKLTNRFYVAVGLYSDRSQMTWKWSKNWKVANKAQPSVSLMLSQHFKSSVIYYCTDPWPDIIYLFQMLKNKVLWMVTSSTSALQRHKQEPIKSLYSSAHQVDRNTDR